MIEQLELKDYVPLLTKGVKRIKLNFNEIVNVLMGRNGFGKSSILRMCALIVPDSSDFNEGGYRYLKYKDDKNNQVFELKSVYGKEPVQSFKLNGKELNDAKNQTVQKALIERYFKIDSNINRYLTGLKTNDLFTFLTPMKRKELFMMIYPNDVTYALKVYEKVKAEYNVTKGAVKSQSRRLMEEKERIKKINEIPEDILNERIKKIDESIKDSLLIQGALTHVKFEDKEHLNLIKKFNKLIHELLNYELADGVQSLEGIHKKISINESIVERSVKRIAVLEDNLVKISESLSGTNVTQLNVDDVKKQLDEQQFLVNEITRNINDVNTLIKEDPYMSKLTNDEFSFFANISNELIPYLNNLVLASDNNLKLSKYQGYLDTHDAKTKYYRNLNNSIDKLAHEIKHYDDMELIKCPECENEFKLGIDSKTIDLKREQLVIDKNCSDKLKEEIKQLSILIEDNAEWFSGMKSLLSFVKQNDVNKRLIELFTHYDLGHRDSNQIINVLVISSKLIKLSSKYNRASSELETLKIRYKALTDFDVKVLMGLYDETEKLNQEEHYVKHRSLKQIALLNRYLDEHKCYQLKLAILDELRVEVMNSFINRSNYDLRLSVEQEINRLNPIKNDLVSQVINLRTQASVLKSIEDDVNHLMTREKRLKILMDGLCPNKGLIGKLMLDFITTVCGNMNAIIKNIFSSPLYIKPCVNSTGNLNYQFPVINGDHKNSIAPDVSDCSGGESDVINFVFRLMLIFYYAPSYPLFMDEVGTKLDGYHQSRFFDYVRRLSLSGEISQLFLISHFTPHVNMFDFANVIALNSDGITIPKVVNKNMEIDYC